jgi:hypothetical protein
MKRNRRLTQFLNTDPIRGWFSIHDAAIFHWVLNNKGFKNQSSGVFEIGVFEGKSTSFISRFVQNEEPFIVCDIFGLNSDELNNLENERSYQGLAAQTFHSNMEKFGLVTPKTLVVDSANLKMNNLGKDFRFIHLDGSHLYEHIKLDLDLAIRLIDKTSGVIAIDDFRAQHTPGVSAAVWSRIACGDITPVVISETKMYCMISATEFDQIEIRAFLSEFDVEYEVEYFLDTEVTRVLGLREEDIFLTFNQDIKSKFRNLTRSILPPLLLDLIRLIKSR